MKKDVLGVKIDDINMDEALETVESWLSKQGKHYIVTPNPEFLVTAQADQEFKKILNNADLAIPDGVGLKPAGIKNTVAGTDLMEKLCELASKKGYSIGLLGGRDGVANLCAKRLESKYTGIKISFAQSESDTGMVCDILFVAFGHPKQEYWIDQNLKNIKVRVAMGVGGAFDYISGKIPRAPKLIRSLGFEWFFRLLIQPWRVKRQISLLKYIWLLTRDTN